MGIDIIGLLINYSFYVCLALIIFFLVAVFINAKPLAGIVRGINKKYLIAVAAVVIIAAGIRLFLVPHRHQVFYDEYEHLDIARNMAESHKFARCNFRLDGRCLSYSITQWLPMHHFLLSGLFALFGPQENVAFGYNCVIGAVSAAALFFAAYLITASCGISLIAAILLTFFPLHLIFSGTSSLEVTSLFWLLVLMVSLFYYRINSSVRSLYLVIASLLLCLYVRPENIVLLPLAVVFLFFCLLIQKKRISAPPLVLFALFSVPYALLLSNIWNYEYSWLQYRGELPVYNFLLANLGFWFSGKTVPVVYSVLAIIGCAHLAPRKLFVSLFLLAYFLIFVSFYSFIHQSNISSGDFQRFNLQFCFPVLFFCAVASYEAYARLRRYFRNRKIPAAVVSFIFALNLIYCLPAVYSPIQSPTLYEEDALFSQARVSDSPCVYISGNPPFITAKLGGNVIKLSFLVNDEVYNAYLGGRCLVLVNDYSVNRTSKDVFSEFYKRFAIDDKAASGIYPKLFLPLRRR